MAKLQCAGSYRDPSMTDMQNRGLQIKQQRIVLRAQYCKLRDLVKV